MATARRAFPLAVLVLIAFSLLLTTPTTNLRAVNVSREPEYKLWGVYWNIQPGFTSTLEMKNNRVSETVTAHVSLYFASGEEYYLRPVLLSPRQTAVIDLNRAIASLPRAVAARASSEGTIEVAFDSGNASAIMASVSVKNPDRGIAWNFFLYPDGYWPEEAVSPLQSAFWLPSSRADGFVAIQNVSDATATLTPRFHVNGAVHQGSPTSLLAGQGFKLELRRELRQLGLDRVNAGGIEIAYQGTPGAILAHGVLFDNQGFSAEMDFLPETALEESTDFFYRTPRLALGPADPALNLPERTKFKPTLVLHNFKGYPVSLNLSFGPSAGSAPTPTTNPLQLAARETRVIELAPILEALSATGPWANLEVSYSGTHSKLGMVLVSVSEDGKHSIRSVLNWVEAAIREGWYWQADDNTNTLLGILNSDTEAATVRMSLDYYVAGQRHSYELPDMSIAARGSVLVDIGQVVASRTPDSDGDVIPPGVTFGGYRVRKTAPRFANITTEVLIVDRREKTFLSVYNTGCCYDWPSTWPGSVSGTPGTNGWLAVQSFDSCTNEPVDFVNNPPLGVRVFFNSDNSSVADIGSQGSFTMIAPGSTTLRSTSVFTYSGNLCRRTTAGGTCSVKVYKVLISAADIVSDQILVSLEPPNLSGNLVVTAFGPSVSKTLFNGTKASGNHTFSFDRNNLPSGQYNTVTATWSVGGGNWTGSKPVAFNVLGTYRHSQYNTPAESACTGSPAAAYITNPQCNFTSTNLRSDFISQSWLNGSGITINFGSEQNEAFCLSQPGAPVDASGRSFRPQAIQPTCVGYSVGNNTVARGDDAPLICGDSILIVGLGGTATTKTVTDRCPACTGQLQLDNYTTQTACQPGTIPDLGNFKTIRLR